nr:trigger factor-like [Hydra vulgaris]
MSTSIQKAALWKINEKVIEENCDSCAGNGLLYIVNLQDPKSLTKIKMEVIYNDVNKAIYKYGKPELKPYEKLIPYEVMFVDGDSVFNLKNIDIVDEKEDYEDDYDEDDDYDYYDYDEDDDYDDYENDYNEVDEIDNEMAVEYDNDEDNDGDKEPMEIDN